MGQMDNLPSPHSEKHREVCGPARVAGSAGTGKQLALHRAVHLARTHPKREFC
jgi:hypothetical protein